MTDDQFLGLLNYPGAADTYGGSAKEMFRGGGNIGHTGNQGWSTGYLQHQR